METFIKIDANKKRNKMISNNLVPKKISTEKGYKTIKQAG